MFASLANKKMGLMFISGNKRDAGTNTFNCLYPHFYIFVC